MAGSDRLRKKPNLEAPTLKRHPLDGVLEAFSIAVPEAVFNDAIAVVGNDPDGTRQFAELVICMAVAVDLGKLTYRNARPVEGSSIQLGNESPFPIPTDDRGIRKVCPVTAQQVVPFRLRLRAKFGLGLGFVS